MEEPLTCELLGKLLSSPRIDDYVGSEPLPDVSLPGYLNQLLLRKGLKRSDVIREAQLNSTFGYQIFMGQRHPSRDKVLQLVFAMHLNLAEANRLLRAAGINELCCKNRRDAIFIFCIDRGLSLQEANCEAYRFGEDTIC